MWPPPLFDSRPPTEQVAWALLGPILTGSICGVLLGFSGTAYTIVFTVMIAGGLLTGFEHLGARDGAAGGVGAGLLFGTFILVAHWISDLPTKASLPHPHIGLLVVTGVFGAALGAIGGALRRRYEQRSAVPTPLA